MIVAIAVGFAVGTYVELWMRWPTFVAVGLGAVMAIVLLMLASSLGEDPAEADAAWRAAAPDLIGRETDAERPGTPKPS